MKKLAGLILVCCLLLACAIGLAENPTVHFAQTNGKVNVGMDYALTVKTSAAVESDTLVSLQCSALNTTYQLVIPAGRDAASLTITPPAESRGKRLDFKLLPGEGYAPSSQGFALQVYSLPQVIFYSPYMIGHVGADKEMSVRVVCQNPNSVVSSCNTFELRDYNGKVLASSAWSNPSKDKIFKFAIPKEMAGKQILSVWLNGVCVSEEPGLLFLSDTSVKRLSTLNPSEPAISITIDCGSPSIKTPQQTRDVLAVLEKYNVKATFFMTGSFVETQTESARMIRDAGHEIAQHTYTHPRMTQESYRNMHTEIIRTCRLLEDKLGVSPRLFRPPYGDTNEKVTAVVRAEGMEEVMWTIDSYDWHAQFNQARIIERVTNAKTLVNGSIILFHINGLKCAENLDQVIPYYQQTKGFKCVPVSELMALSGLELPPMPADREALVYNADAQ